MSPNLNYLDMHKQENVERKESTFFYYYRNIFLKERIIIKINCVYLCVCLNNLNFFGCDHKNIALQTNQTIILKC